MPAGAWLTEACEAPAGPAAAPADGVPKTDAAPAPEAASSTLSWNLACERFLRRHAHAPYPTSRRTTAPSEPSAVGLSRNSSMTLGSGAGAGAFLAGGFGASAAGLGLGASAAGLGASAAGLGASAAGFGASAAGFS